MSRSTGLVVGQADEPVGTDLSTSLLGATDKKSHPSVRLGDVARFIRGITFKPAQVLTAGDASGPICLRTKNVQAGLDLRDVIRVPRAMVRREEQFVKQGDVVVSTANSWNLIGKSVSVQEIEEPMAIGGFISVLRPDPLHIDARYLYRWFSSSAVQSTVRGFASQTTNIANLNVTRTADLKVPLPPLPEQRRIAAILDRADELRAKHLRYLELLDELADAVFIDMFINGEDWERCGLLDICDTYSGGTPSKQVPEYWDGTLPWFSPKDMKRSELFDSIDHISTSALDETTLRLMPRDTVVVVVRGMILAHTFPVARLRVPATINQDMKALFPKRKISSAYLLAALRAASPQVLSAVSAAGHGTKRLDSNALAEIRIPVAPSDLQLDFEEKTAEIAELRIQMSRRAEATEALFSSLQNRAFNGGL